MRLANLDPLLSAALGGLLGLGCQAPSEPDPCVPERDASLPDAPSPVDAPTGPVVLSETEGSRTYASLRAECDARGGYVQIHAACAGVNACAGFSYGDWDPGVLSEHTCAGINGCNGLSCVVLPPDEGRSGADLLALELPEDGPRSCSTCHAHAHGDTVDPSTFRVFVLPGSGRDETNWLDGVSAEEQARIVAFGSSGRLPDGQAFSHMRAYHRLFSRAEIERVVEHIRTGLTIEIVPYRVMD